MADSIAEKVCFKCGEKKPLTEFYKHSAMADGHVNKCKTCNKKDVSKNYRDNIDHYKEYDKERNSNRTETLTITSREHRHRNPEKYKARTALNNALRDGKIIKTPCIKCGSEENIQGHHEDYSKPLEVEWLCFTCHRKDHGQFDYDE